MVSWTYITSNTTWQPPEGVNGVIIIASGGGGGGGCAMDEFGAGGGGGGGTIQQVGFVPVNSEINYTITIGNGGSGGFIGPTQDGYCGLDGEPTIFANGNNILFYTKGAGGAGTNTGAAFNHGGFPWSNPFSTYVLEDASVCPVIPGSGGGWDGSNAFSGLTNSVNNFSGGAFSNDNYKAGGGGAGPQGDGGDAGTTLSPDGDDASSNTGAGGGGGNQGCTRGGNGGSGYMYIIW
jgi:hypothetical protein